MRQPGLEREKSPKDSAKSRSRKRTSAQTMLLVEPRQMQMMMTTSAELETDQYSNQRDQTTSSSSSNRSSLERQQSDHYVIDSSAKEIHQKALYTSSSSRRETRQVENRTTSSSRQNQQEEEVAKRHKTMRNNKLTSMLVILFGFLLLAAASGVSSNVTTTIATPTTPVQPATTTTTATRLLLGNHSAPADALSADERDLTTPSSAEELSSDDETELLDKKDDRLGSLIVDTASAAVDKIFIEPKRAAAAAESDIENESESENDTSAEASDSAETLPSTNSTATTATTSAATATATTTTTTTTTTSDQEQLREALQVYKKWKSTGDDIIELFSTKVLPLVMESTYDLDPVTMTNLLQIFNAIRQLKPWSLKLLDAWAKLTPGILLGTQSDFGDFDECLSVRADNPSGLNEDDVGRGELDPLTGLKSTTIVGKYCIADVEFPKPPRVRLSQRNEELSTDFAPIELRRPLLNFNETAEFKETIFVETGNFFNMLYVDPIRVGICLTNKIDPDAFASIINKLVKDFSVSIHFKGRCVTKYDKPAWSSEQVVSAYVLLAACSLVLLSTLLDLLHMKLNKLPLPSRFSAWKLNVRSSMRKYQPLFTSFSIIRNTKRLFKRQQPQQSSKAAQPQQYHHLSNNYSGAAHQHSVISAELAKTMALCSTSTSALVTDTSSSSQESSSIESSPSIERRSSLASSAIYLISEPTSPSTKQAPHLANNLSLFVKPPKEKLGREENNLNCLHGIRVITMTWMIVNHTYLFGGFFVLWAHRRLIDIAEWPKSLSFQLVLNGWLTVETYFFLSAAIVVLNVMPLMKSKKFAYFSYITHRLIRLLPAYIGLVCLNFLWPLVSSGPVWLVKGRSFIQTPCENYLWTNFLFINNWIWPEKQCMVHTWFLSADFQLYLIAPIIVYLLYRRPVFGHSLNIIVAVLASILSGFVIYANKLMPTTLINRLEFDAIKQQLSYSYFATYQHMGPYCLGIFIGYLLYKRPQVQLPKHLTWCLWLLLPPLSFTTLLLTYLWNGAYDEPSLINPSPIVSAFYVAIHRTIWTSLLAWIVFACATGRAKIMSSFLSNPIFVPLSRLSFSIYLVHLPVIMFRALNLRHTIEWTDSNILWEACGNFVVSLVFGYFLNIFFESPIINLERVVFGRATQRGNFRENLKSCNQSKLNEAGESFTPKSGDNSPMAETASESEQMSPPRETRRLAPSSAMMWKNSSGSDNDDNDNDDYTRRESTGISTASQQQQQRVNLIRREQQQQTDKLSSSSIGSNLEHQLESLATTKLTSLATTSTGDDKATQVAPSNDDNSATISGSQRFYNEAKFLSGDGGGVGNKFDGDLYPAARFHGQPNPDRPYSRQQFFNRHSYPARPMQYATLARTSRPSQDDWPTLSRQSLDDDHHHHYYPYPSHSNFGLPNKARSHLGEPTAQRSLQAASSMTNNLSRRRFDYSSQRRMVGSQRSARYNTLTSTVGIWPSQRYPLDQSSAGAISSSGAEWLQPGTLLPRIDSSTLRRQSKLPTQQEATTSIAEESHSLDDNTEHL